MEIGLSGIDTGDAIYWRLRAQESRETARRMTGTGPRQGMLLIAGIYDKLAARAELDRLSPAQAQAPRRPARP